MALPEKIDTVVLAGGINRITLLEGNGPSWKALISVGGKPCVQYVLDALKEVPAIGRTCLVGPKEPLQKGIVEPGRYEYAPEGRSFGGSVFSGLAHFPDSQGILFVTADLPLLTPGPVADFIAVCRRETEPEEKLCLSGVDRSRFTGAYRSAPKRFSRFRDATVCHGNLALIQPRILETSGLISRERLDTIYRSRKKTLTTCWAFGWPFVLGYLLGGSVMRLFTLEQVLRTASRRFRVELVPIFLNDPAIALDIDEPADYAFAVDFLQKASCPTRGRQSDAECGTEDA